MLTIRDRLARIGRAELMLLGAFGVPACLLTGFLVLAGEMQEGETKSFDEAILLALRSPGDTANPIGPPWVEAMLTDFTSLGSNAVLTFITVAVVVYLLLAWRNGTALLVFIAIAGGALMSSTLKGVYDRPRPDLVAHIVQTSSASFPSGHAMLAAVTYLTLGSLLARLEPDPRLKLYLIGLALLLAITVGFSRVYLGVHYPTDVLAGWSLGAAWAIGCSVVALWLQRAGRIRT